MGSAVVDCLHFFWIVCFISCFGFTLYIKPIATPTHKHIVSSHFSAIGGIRRLKHFNNNIIAFATFILTVYLLVAISIQFYLYLYWLSTAVIIVV